MNHGEKCGKIVLGDFMELIIADKKQLKKIKKLYKKAFPRCERCPFRLLLNQRKNGTGELFALVDGKSFTGFVIMAFHGDFALINYFAIEDALRGKGMGTDALELIKDKYRNKRLFLESELPDEHNPNNVQQLRRLAFYKRCGFRVVGNPVSVFNNRFLLMSCGEGISFDEYVAVLTGVFGSFVALNVKELHG